MAENNNTSNNGHSPFRRYVPPQNPGNGANSGQVMPFPSANARDRQPGSSPTRRSRSARSRWRQWIHAKPSSPTRDQRRSVPSPAPRQAVPPEADRKGGNPAERSSQPPSSSAMPRPSAFVQNMPGQPTPPPPQNIGPPPRPFPHAQRSSGTLPRTADANKVTPLRRQPVWSSPPETSGRPGELRRDRRAPRRRVKKAPRPVLYGIRLLILGTGIAAIAGTILSTLNPNREATGSNAAPNQGAEVFSSQPARQRQATALSSPLPLAEELAYLETDLVALEAMTPGLTQSVFFYDLDTGNYIDINGSNTVSAASTIKVPILVAFLEAVDQGRVQLNQAVTLREDLIAGGSGDMQTHEVGSQYTALEVATEMIINSDNTATNMMIDLLGGQDVLNQRFREWGLTATVLRNPLPDLEGTNTTSPVDLVRLMALVDQGEVLQLRSRDRLLSIMQRTYTRTLIPDGLGDDTAVVANKTGDIGAVLGDVALVDVLNGRRYILSVLVTRPHNDGRANELVRRIAGRIHEEMTQPISPIGGRQPSSPSTNPAPGENGNPGNEALDPQYQAPEATPYTTPETTPYANPEVPRG